MSYGNGGSKLKFYTNRDEQKIPMGGRREVIIQHCPYKIDSTRYSLRNMFKRVHFSLFIVPFQNNFHSLWKVKIKQLSNL